MAEQPLAGGGRLGSGLPAVALGGGDNISKQPITVQASGLKKVYVVSAPVETTQIAPTILRLLGLNPGELKAVRIEHTRVLPGLRGGW